MHVINIVLLAIYEAENLTLWGTDIGLQLFYRFLFVVEMEMTILGSRHFLLFPSQK